MKSFLATLIAFWIAVIAVSAQSSAANGRLIDNPVYQKDCAKCHGKTGEGRHFGGPSLVSEKVVATSSEDLRFNYQQW